MDEDKGIEEFSARFQALAEEAQGFGLSSVVILATADPLSKEQVIYDVGRAYRLEKIGMLQQVLWVAQRDT